MTKAKKFEVGDRIGMPDDYDGKKLRYNPDEDSVYYGTILDLPSNGRVMVKWDDSWMNDDAESIELKDLFHEAELKEKMSVLEAAFEQVEKDVKDKMKEAAVALLDAQKIAKKGGFDLIDLYNATSTLEKAMDKCGWNSSSFHC